MKKQLLLLLITASVISCKKSDDDPDTKINHVPYSITLISKPNTTVQLQVSGINTRTFVINSTGTEKIIEYYPESETKTIIASVPFDEGIEMKIDFHSPASGSVFSQYNKNKVTAVFTVVKK